MKIIYLIKALILPALFFTGCSADTSKLKILIVTGGHEIEREAFFDVYNSFQNIDYKEIVQPEANKIYASAKVDKYDAIVFYDMVQDISEEQKAAFLQMLEKGKGIVFLHHSIVSYKDWDEFHAILGGRYNLKPGVRDSVPFPASSYKHDQKIPVTIIDKEHPVTAGVQDFVIQDETYNNFDVSKTVHKLLSTDHPENGKILGWSNSYGKSRIVYLQLGHNHFAFENPNYRKLVKQAIEWASCE